MLRIIFRTRKSFSPMVGGGGGGGGGVGEINFFKPLPVDKSFENITLRHMCVVKILFSTLIDKAVCNYIFNDGSEKSYKK